MLWTTVVVLVALWALLLIGGYAMGAWIHLLLVAALAVIVTRVFTGRSSSLPRGSVRGDAWSDPVSSDDVIETADIRRS